MTIHIAIASMASALLAIQPLSSQGTAADAVPSWAAPTLRRALSDLDLSVFDSIRPTLQGDLDGDGQVDLAVQVRHRRTHKRGVLIIHHADASIHLLGAGVAFGNGGDDFSWLWEWDLRSRSVLRGAPVRGRYVLYVGKPESAGGMIWWDGQRYHWTQWGD